ncbi:MAG: hypothetical protein MZV64_68495 [Ignavibacteriales bacterium]|nr:hypothetical protein [Ignavibacteriales bacterium]
MSFSFDKEVTLPGTPEVIFDAVTGDISGWWDHSFTDNPKEFYIEPVPGGGFWEIFDDEGNGVLHARVIYADRGKDASVRWTAWIIRKSNSGCNNISV